MGRKNLLADLIETGSTSTSTSTSTEGASPAQITDAKPSVPTLGSRGAVGAMRNSLEKLSAQREALAEQLSEGQAVLELDPGLMDGSIVRDRMKGSDEDHHQLMESIRTTGQIVPILVRPHPSEQGRYQIAYGHRRVRATFDLKQKVRAVVRNLSDEELVIAQGKENGERKDLAFIERAMFALTLEDRGFRRETIMSALSVDKSEVSRLISVAKGVDPWIVEAIGSAPKTGRRPWLDLQDRLKKDAGRAKVTSATNSKRFATADSDTRLAIVLSALSDRAPAPQKSSDWVIEDGKRIAQIERRGDRTLLALNESVTPAFGEFLFDKIPELYRTYLADGKKDPPVSS